MSHYAGRAIALASLALLPSMLLVGVVALGLPQSSALRLTAVVGSLAWWAVVGIALHRHLVRPLRTLSNLLAGLREGDFSTRARIEPGWDDDDPLGASLREANALADVLHEQRLGAVDATNLLRRVMGQVEVAVLAFDEDGKLHLANAAAERLLEAPAEHLRGRSAADLGLAECLEGQTPRLLQPSFAAGMGRWELRRASFRQRGRPFSLLVLSDLSRALQEEERGAWQRLVRVLSHEINNSLAPISSVADGFSTRLARGDQGDQWRADLREGLEVIAGRARGLGRFMAAHAKLARLPPPTMGPVEVGAWVRRVAALETRVPLRVVAGPPLGVQADADQLDQLLINLVRNAADAALETGGGVAVTWSRQGDRVCVQIDDEGPGLVDTANLFVPFFSTKPGGSGIGLALAQQIARAHGGGVTLDNHDEGPGCVARVWLRI